MVHQIWEQFQRWGVKNALKNIGYHGLYHQERRSFGDKNSDKTIYIIRGVAMSSRLYLGVTLDLLAGYSYVLSHMVYAQRMGWYPVVDQLNYPLNYQEDFEINGTKNGWEYFWVQPSEITLREAYQSKHVVLSKRSWYQPGNIEYSVPAHMDLKVIQRFHQLAELAHLNGITDKYCSDRYVNYFPSGGRILGVASRGGVMAKDTPKPAPSHPIQPGIDELIRIAGRKMKEWDMDYIFVTTEREEILERFQQAFGSALLAIPRRRFRIEEKEMELMNGVEKNPLYAPTQRYKTALDYLTEMELLARCDGLIGAVTSGLRYAIFRNGGAYERLEVLDLGCFPDPRRKDICSNG